VSNIEKRAVEDKRSANFAGRREIDRRALNGNRELYLLYNIRARGLNIFECGRLSDERFKQLGGLSWGIPRLRLGMTGGFRLFGLEWQEGLGFLARNGKAY